MRGPATPKVYKVDYTLGFYRVWGLANLAPYARSLSSLAAQRLVSLFDMLARRCVAPAQVYFTILTYTLGFFTVWALANLAPYAHSLSSFAAQRPVSPFDMLARRCAAPANQRDTATRGGEVNSMIGFMKGLGAGQPGAPRAQPVLPRAAAPGLPLRHARAAVRSPAAPLGVHSSHSR